MKSQLYARYVETIAPKLMKEFGMTNISQVPKIEKICVNIGMGSYLQKLGTKDYSHVEEALMAITGQKPILRRARMSVSNFKLREGMPVGLMVTLRKERAYNFLDKVINIVYPRVQGFRGVKRTIFDEGGNCSFGFAEHTVFPEISVDDARKVHGVQVTIVTNTTNKKHTERLLEEMGFPFVKSIPKETKESK